MGDLAPPAQRAFQERAGCSKAWGVLWGCSGAAWAGWELSSSFFAEQPRAAQAEPVQAGALLPPPTQTLFGREERQEKKNRRQIETYLGVFACHPHRSPSA